MIFFLKKGFPVLSQFFKILKYFDEKDSHLLMEGMQYGTSTLEDSLAFSYKTEHALTIQSSNHTLFTQS